jgi:GNAT superfamily N-acetyltransferase
MKTNSPIRLAQPSDEPELISLLRLMWKEGGWRPLDIDCAREIFARAFRKQGGILPVIGAPGAIRAMMYLLITRHWYTRANHLEELFCFVHPEHRHSDYSKLLIEHAKQWSDDLSKTAGMKVPLLMGVLTNKKMSAKVRLYRRFFGMPAGAFFIHNADWASHDEISEEDFWRAPSLANKLFKKAERRVEREKQRARV